MGFITWAEAFIDTSTPLSNTIRHYAQVAENEEYASSPVRQVLDSRIANRHDRQREVLVLSLSLGETTTARKKSEAASERLPACGDATPREVRPRLWAPAPRRQDRSAHRGRSMRWPRPISPPRLLLVLLSVTLCSIPGTFSSRNVTLDTIDIFTTHEWFSSKPAVYFHCNGDNKTHLPDVKEANLIYTFKGEESWQPLTELPEKKCKRCGLYEDDIINDDVFDEWELCSSEFKDGKYTHFKEGQFNATFLCPNCTASAGDSATHHSSSEVEAKKTSVVVIIIVSVLASVVVVLALFGGYKYWLKKKRERDQLRFLKLFEEGDDIEDELGLSNEL